MEKSIEEIMYECYNEWDEDEGNLSDWMRQKYNVAQVSGRMYSICWFVSEFMPIMRATLVNARFGEQDAGVICAEDDGFMLANGGNLIRFVESVTVANEIHKHPGYKDVSARALLMKFLPANGKEEALVSPKTFNLARLGWTVASNCAEDYGTGQVKLHYRRRVRDLIRYLDHYEWDDSDVIGDVYEL